MRDDQDIMTSDRIAEAQNFNRESVRLNLLKDKVLKQLDEVTQERDALRMAAARLMHENEIKATAIAQLNEQKVRCHRVIAGNEELISRLQVDHFY